jgi:uncharacterized protein (DUF1330 family)
MRYLIASRAASGQLPQSASLLADGEMISLEQPWTFGPPLIARLEDDADLDALKAAMSAAGHNAFVVEGLEEPRRGEAFILGAHIMRDMEGFRPYAEAVPEVVKALGGRFLARGGTVTPIAGAFTPERVVLTEFATAGHALAFYISDRYAPLLKIRLATTEARLVIVAREGEIPAVVHAHAADYLRHPA